MTPEERKGKKEEEEAGKKKEKKVVPSAPSHSEWLAAGEQQFSPTSHSAIWEPALKESLTLAGIEIDHTLFGGRRQLRGLGVEDFLKGAKLPPPLLYRTRVTPCEALTSPMNALSRKGCSP